jgi:hypothetical protein
MGQMNDGDLLTANPAGHSLIDKFEGVIKDNQYIKEQLAVMNSKIRSQDRRI